MSEQAISNAKALRRELGDLDPFERADFRDAMVALRSPKLRRLAINALCAICRARNHPACAPCHAGKP